MFDYRIAYGCWLNDSRMKPIADEDWPSVRIDRDTLDSLDRTMGFLAECGYNCLDVFGLITNHSWQPDIPSTVSPERKEWVRQAIEIVHRHGLKLIYGLGVYSWGFDRIIAHSADVRGTNPQVMCASSGASLEVMQRVIDYVSQTFEVDGFHLEAADQGRCACGKCAGFASDIDYFNHVNRLTASYIRERYPDKLLLVNTSGYLAWGDRFSEEQLEKIRELGEWVDVFIDVGSHGEFVAQKDRKALISRMHASYGTANGFWIYPPQRWDRQRWLIPHFLQNHEHLKALYGDGGRSAELYLSPINNPGAELTQMCNGLFMQHPERGAMEILREAVARLYAGCSAEDQAQIVDIFVQAERLFFACWTPRRRRGLDPALSDGVEHIFIWSKTDPGRAVPGELFLEPLWGVGAGFPCYLTVHFDKAGRQKYRQGIAGLAERVRGLAGARENQRVRGILACLEHTLHDIGRADAADAES